MRPRLRAAENAGIRSGFHTTTSRFNEAAAESRGKPGMEFAREPEPVASMRPRLRAAENEERCFMAANRIGLQ